VGSQGIFHRVVNASLPDVDVFDDIGEKGDFAAIYKMHAHALTNARNSFLAKGIIKDWEVPRAGQQVHIVLAPFIYVPFSTSRFSAGEYGVLYAADSVECALAEVCYHLNKHFMNVNGLQPESVMLNEFVMQYTQALDDVTEKKELHHPNSYRKSQAFGSDMQSHIEALRFTLAFMPGASANSKYIVNPAYNIEADYHFGVFFKSVRYKGGRCIGLFSPFRISNIKKKRQFTVSFENGCLGVAKESILSF
jgi:hypothetical protein